MERDDSKRKGVKKEAKSSMFVTFLFIKLKIKTKDLESENVPQIKVRGAILELPGDYQKI